MIRLLFGYIYGLFFNSFESIIEEDRHILHDYIKSEFLDTRFFEVYVLKQTENFILNDTQSKYLEIYQVQLKFISISSLLFSQISEIP